MKLSRFPESVRQYQAMSRSDCSLNDATSGYQNRAKQPNRPVSRFARSLTKAWHQRDALVDQRPRNSSPQRRPYMINKGRSWVNFLLLATALTKKERFMPEW